MKKPNFKNISFQQNKRMLLNSKGLQIGNLYIPPFQVFEGDFVVINIFNGVHFYDTSRAIIEVLDGSEKHKNVEIHSRFHYAQHIKLNSLKNRLFPKTIGKFIKENSLTGSFFEKYLFEKYSYLDLKTKMTALPGNPRRLLSVMKTLSKTNRIVFDLAGNDFMGGKMISNFIKKEISTKGAAVLIDTQDDDFLKGIRTKYIQAEILNDN